MGREGGGVKGRILDPWHNLKAGCERNESSHEINGHAVTKKKKIKK